MSIKRTFYLVACLGGILASFSAALFALPPNWWGTRQVLSTASPDDYAVANLGQLKTIAKKAYEEMESSLPGGAGPAISQLVQSWAPSSPQSDDFAALTLGQLKTVGGMFRSRLAEVWPQYSAEAWLAGSPDDFALATLGQLKTVFAFEITGDPLGGGADDFDRDGLTNAQEMAWGTDPRKRDSDDDGITDGQEVAEGTAPLDALSSSAALLALSFRSRVE